MNSTGARAPFGEPYAYGSGAPPEAFTGQDGDGQRSNPIYWFPERQYVATQGRWISPDLAGLAAADPSNPQSWNRYGYVANNPLALTDPSGTCTGGGCPPPPTNACPLVFTGCGSNNFPCLACGLSSWDNLTQAAVVVGYTSTAVIDPDTGQIISTNYSPVFDTAVLGTFIPANNGNFSWWGAFAKNLFSWKNFTDEFKEGGCVGVFVDAASEGGILPDLPAGHGVEDAVTDASKMAAATYAVNQGLVVPLRSSAVRGILDLGETSASGLVLADTYAKIGAGGLAEYNAIKNGNCH